MNDNPFSAPNADAAWRVPYQPFWFKNNWYFIDDRRVLSGPHTSLLDCENFMSESRREFPRS